MTLFRYPYRHALVSLVVFTRSVIHDAVSHIMKAEKLLKETGIPYKTIPVPKSISADCGRVRAFPP